jgi:hypothetical protein
MVDLNHIKIITVYSIRTTQQEWGKDYEGKMEGARKAFADMGLDDNIAEDVGKLLGVGNTVKLFEFFLHSLCPILALILL